MGFYVSFPSHLTLPIPSSILVVLIFASVAFAVESGRITLTKTDMQKAADAAALAASQEIVGVLSETSEGGGASDGNVRILPSVSRNRARSFRILSYSLRARVSAVISNSITGAI